MRIFIKLILILLFLQMPLSAFAQKTIAVLAADNTKVYGYSYIFGNASAMLAQDITNRFNVDNTFIAKDISQIENVRNLDLLKYDYRNAGIIQHEGLKKFASNTGVDYILLVTSNIDIQSHLMDNTIWCKLNIPGIDTISSNYMLYVFVTLIDAKNQNVLWQEVFENKMKADKFNAINPVSTPNYVQIKEIKRISNKLSSEIALMSKLCILNPAEFEMREIHSNSVNVKNNLKLTAEDIIPPEQPSTKDMKPTEKIKTYYKYKGAPKIKKLRKNMDDL